MRASEVVGGLSVIGVIVLIGFAIADDADSGTITTPTAPTILAPLDSAPDTDAPSPETTTSAPETETESSEAPADTEPEPADTEPPATDAPETTATTSTTTIPSIPVEERAGVRVRVVNAGGPAGAATFATGVLEGAGFDPANPGDGVTNVDQSIVLFAAGQNLAATTVNESIGAPPEFVIEANPEDPNWAEFGSEVDVLVLIGPQ